MRTCGALAPGRAIRYRKTMSETPKRPPLTETLQLAEVLAEAGRAWEARALCRAVLRRAPDELRAQRLLSGLPSDADLEEQAAPDLVEKKALIADFLAGRLDATTETARAFCRRAPADPFGWKVLGAACQRLGRTDDALAACRAAAVLAPEDAEARLNLGVCWRAAQRPDAAEACCREALALAPGLTGALRELSSLLAAQGRLDEAEACCRRLAALHPEDGAAWGHLGAVLLALGRTDEALPCSRKAAELLPGDAGALVALGGVLLDLGRAAEAEAVLQRAVLIAPDLPEGHADLGRTQNALGRNAAAERSLRRALALAPDDARLWCNLAAILRDADRLDEAAQCCRTALARDPRLAQAHNNLGVVLKETGRLAEALASFRQALALAPEDLETRSNLLYLLNYSEEFPRAMRRAEALDYGRAAARRARPFTSWRCEPTPQRLRVGLVSGDLRAHAVGHFLEAVLARVDPARVELCAYPTDPREDALTERIKPRFAIWRPLDGRDAEAARAIRDDGAHVLLDLSGHTAGNRLPVFAWRPAPAQAAWLGYAATTGLAEMDCVLADPWTLPEEFAADFTEAVERLPETRLCFTPPEDAPEVAPLPALRNGCVTFGCFNDLAKVNDAVIALWVRVLAAAPGARLLLKAGQLADPALRRRTAERFAAQGLALGRLLLEGPEPRAAYLAAYGRVDIALDPFPHPGGATSAEGLWMGAPCVTLAGSSFLARQGAGVLANAGLSGWIAADADDYVAKAAARAADVPALAAVRAGLRERARLSPLFDAARFARHLEDALWNVWRRFGAPRI